MVFPPSPGAERDRREPGVVDGGAEEEDGPRHRPTDPKELAGGRGKEA